MLQKMKSILVVGPKTQSQQIIDVLYKSGTLHLESAYQELKGISLLRWIEVQQTDEITALLVKIGGYLQIIHQIGPKQDLKPEIEERLNAFTHEELLLYANSKCDLLDLRIRTLATKKSELDLRITTLTRYKKVLIKISPLENQLPTLEGFDVTILIAQKEYAEVLDIIQIYLKEITRNQFEFIAADLDEKNFAVITVFSKKYSKQIHDFLFAKNINEVRIPPDYANMPLDEALNLIERDINTAREDIAEIDSELAGLSIKYYDDLESLQFFLEDRYEEILAYSNFAQTDYTIVIKGWIPKKFLKRTKKALHDHFGDRVIVTVLPDDRESLDNAPVFYDNPFWVKPFEFFMQLVSPPQYREVDPTPLFAIFFPLFFGFIVGDIGYGLIIMIFALAIRYKFKNVNWMKSLSEVLIISSIPTIFFGYLFGEFFGDFAEINGWLHPIHLIGITWNRVEAIIPLLILTIGIGVLHVFLGLGLGAYNAFIHRKKKHLCEKCGMMGFIGSLILLIGIFLVFLPQILLYPILTIAVVSLILIIYGGGTVGAIEIMGTIGNIMSYSRLMAIGLASVILALVANKLGEEIEIFGIGIIVAILLHSLNIVLAMFSPSIHSLRLHVVEFFSKFYEGGGKPYIPFGRSKE